MNATFLGAKHMYYSMMRYCVYYFMKVLPQTRCYPLKAMLLRACGYNVHPTCRIISSAEVLGAFELTIGARTFVSHDVLITGGPCHIDIGADVAIGPRVSIIAGSHEWDMVGPRTAGKDISNDITIEDGAAICANTTILGGVRIGRKALIGAGSVVRRDVPAYAVAEGSPCRCKVQWNEVQKRWQPWRAAGV